MTPDKRRTTPLVQLLATGWSHAHDGKPLNLVPCRWRMTAKAYQLDPSERKLRDNNQARLRKTLGEEQFERAYTTGTSLSLERACDLALGKTNPK